MIPMIVVDPHSRVKLKKIAGEDFSEYINANYVTVSFFSILSYVFHIQCRLYISLTLSSCYCKSDQLSLLVYPNASKRGGLGP